MDIKDVSAEISRAAHQERSDPSRRGSASAKANKTVGKQDLFENSSQLGRVRAHIETIIKSPEVDTKAIKRGKELLESGQLDSHESATKAAEGFLAEGGGTLG